MFVVVTLRVERSPVQLTGATRWAYFCKRTISSEITWMISKKTGLFGQKKFGVSGSASWKTWLSLKDAQTYEAHHFLYVTLAKIHRQALLTLNDMCMNALSHSTHSLRYLSMLKNKSVFRFCAIPQVILISFVKSAVC
jgi:hypothetical protein